MNIEKSFNIALAMRGINKKQLAEKARMTQPYISQVTRNGSLSVKRLDELANLLDFKLWEFIRLGDEQNEKE